MLVVRAQLGLRAAEGGPGRLQGRRQLAGLPRLEEPAQGAEHEGPGQDPEQRVSAPSIRCGASPGVGGDLGLLGDHGESGGLVGHA